MQQKKRCFSTVLMFYEKIGGSSSANVKFYTKTLNELLNSAVFFR